MMLIYTLTDVHKVSTCITLSNCGYFHATVKGRLRSVMLTLAQRTCRETHN